MALKAFQKVLRLLLSSQVQRPRRMQWFGEHTWSTASLCPPQETAPHTLATLVSDSSKGLRYCLGYCSREHSIKPWQLPCGAKSAGTQNESNGEAQQLPPTFKKMCWKAWMPRRKPLQGGSHHRKLPLGRCLVELSEQGCCPPNPRIVEPSAICNHRLKKL